MTVEQWNLQCLRCDHDGCTVRGPITGESITKAMELAVDAGWRADGWYKSWCPDHRAEHEVSEPTFFELLKAGDATEKTFADYVERWHAAATNVSLAAYLGMTEEQYGFFIGGTTPPDPADT